MKNAIVMACAISCAFSCSTSPREPQAGATARALGSSASVVPGFNHTLATTRFQVGPGVSTAIAGGFTRTSGTTGAFSVNNVNGAAAGVMNSLENGGVPFIPYSSGQAAHEAAVQGYFLAAGLPADQAGPMHTNVSAKGSGPGGSGLPPLPTWYAYSSIVTRSVGGYLVPESHAWARLDGNGNVVAENVYWPPLDAATLADAQTLTTTLASASAAAAYLAKLPLPTDVSSMGSVVIHHTSEFETSSFVDVACYDVWFGSAIGGMGGGWTRHFNVSGAEVRLPQELRQGHPSSRH